MISLSVELTRQYIDLELKIQLKCLRYGIMCNWNQSTHNAIPIVSFLVRLPLKHKIQETCRVLNTLITSSTYMCCNDWWWIGAEVACAYPRYHPRVSRSPLRGRNHYTPVPQLLESKRFLQDDGFSFRALTFNHYRGRQGLKT